MTMRVLIVDDHELIQNALRLTIRELDAQCNVSAAKDFSEAAHLIEESSPFDFALLDLGLPGMDGLTALVEMRKRYPQLPVVVVSAQSDRPSVVQAINLGAMGYIPKNTPGESIVAALRTIIAGGIYLPPEIVRQTTALPSSSSNARPATHAPGLGRANHRRGDFGLTSAQMNVLKLLLRGLPNKLICRELHLAESTVKTHLKSIFAALNVSNRTQAVLAANELGIAFGHNTVPGP